MRLIVRSKWTSILFWPHFPRLINDDSARSAGCFCWLVPSFPEIFSLQLAWGEAKKSNRNLAPRKPSFCTPGSFVRNRYCLCELKLFVLKWEKWVSKSVRNLGHVFNHIACSLLITYYWHRNQPCCLLWCCSKYSQSTTHVPSLKDPKIVFLPLNMKWEGGAAIKIFGLILITGLHVFLFFWQLVVPQRAESLQDKSCIHSQGIRSNLPGYKGKKEQGGCRGEREDPTVTNDYEHLLISLAFITVDGKLGLVCSPTVFWMG